ncbi:MULTISPECIES: MCE family protein [Actinoallomurus]|uniref:MCE family protein n=1 Tax=Actinoallomurus TaxID=667113 RepID=UPI002091F547|nr:MULTISPECIES: MCE family protein [Actinoallomurus]MCO5973034.1 MCE family protein [Actinoallomurus soli]MCO5998427.1 MCE family protein [Actinoallomurus rhizosphaericola]
MGSPGSPRRRDSRPTRVLAYGAAVLAVVLVAALVAVFWPGGEQTHVTAYFERATGVYRGTEVRVLGVKVGKVTRVIPKGNMVEVGMAYDAKRKIPANAQAVIIVPSLVADRYIQFTPVYRGGAALKNGATLPLSSTAVPVELDDANQSVNDLAKALGPQGANANGALSRLLKSSAQTLDGQGEDFKQTLQDLSEVSRILADNRSDASQTVRNLAKITQAMAASDRQIRAFSENLATVSGTLNAERTELTAALKSLTVALQEVSAFVKQNKTQIAANVQGLAQVTGILVKEKQALQNFLDKAPVAATNAMSVYDYQDGTLHSRLNLMQSQNIAMWLCSLAYSLGAPPKQCETLLKPLNALGAPLSKIGLDLSGLTEATTHFDVVPPPADAYGSGSAPTAAKRTKTTGTAASANPDPTFGGILAPPSPG